MMVYHRSHLPILLPLWMLIINNLFFLMFFCQLISSSTKFDNRALNIVKSIDDYLCQNHIFTCFFRQSYHQLFDQQQSNNCKSLLILHLCIHYDTDIIRMCRQSILSQVQKILIAETPTYCFTLSVYKTLSAQHLRSIALPRMTINCRIFMFFLILLSFAIRRRIYS
jgi:hypothetical protein